MKVEQLEHVLRAAADVIGQSDFLVIGSAAILASFPDEELPIEATRSDEADLAPYDDPDGNKADRIDGAIGEGSPFHTLFGYYAQGVGFETATLPDGWRSRLVEFDAPANPPGRGHCLERHDLAVSKLLARRPKDFEFVEALLERFLDARIIRDRLDLVPKHKVPAQILANAIRWIEQRPGDPLAARSQRRSTPMRADRAIRCRVCHRVLKDEATRRAGIGRDCAEKERRGLTRRGPTSASRMRDRAG